jgi:hypothetical protein
MKVSHAAPLALVGWYLMMPPIVRMPHGSRNLSAGKPIHGLVLGWTDEGFSGALSHWQIVGSYDTAAECKAEIATLRPSSIPNGLTSTEQKQYEQLQPLQIGNALCIATDDPRLKENEAPPCRCDSPDAIGWFQRDVRVLI